MRKILALSLLILPVMIYGAGFQVLVKVPHGTNLDSVVAAGVAIDSTFGEAQISNSNGVVFIIPADSLGDTLLFAPLKSFAGVEIIGVEVAAPF